MKTGFHDPWSNEFDKVQAFVARCWTMHKFFAKDTAGPLAHLGLRRSEQPFISQRAAAASPPRGPGARSAPTGATPRLRFPLPAPRRTRTTCQCVARMVPIGPGGLQSGFSIPRYVRRDFRKKKSGPRTPRPPGGPPVLGSLVWRAEGLPSTRNWPFRWPLSPTSPPQMIPKAM
jgi:hypothetical protein